ncbi:acyl-CoA dehydrogenase family protein [Actinoplanes sp. NPDC049118]|uniref:acyl-CoA dehydrogenase family protein n=1 Tax=Actinoplanes sp. NPDC049118 TaxID=3155769 RepID=UPI0033CAD691
MTAIASHEAALAAAARVAAALAPGVVRRDRDAGAKAFAGEVAVETASELFAMCGTSSTAAKYDLDRHWRNARTHSVHDPADWKYHHLAAWELAGVQPPNHGQL